MITSTQAARTRLSEMLADYSDDVAVRVLIRNRKRKIRPDTRRPGDAVIEHEGRAVLLLDAITLQRLRDRTLDVRETPDGPKLRFRAKAK